MSTTQPAGEHLLDVRGLTKHFPIRHGIVFQRQIGAVHAVDGIDFTVAAGQSLGLVGESGCGKSTTGRLVTRLLEPTAGKVVFDGEDITHTPENRMKEARRNLQMIFQDPYSSLNPRHTVGTIVETPMRLNGINPPQGHKKRAQELLETVGLSPEHYNRYPNEFSGGQRQRIGIARALALRPKLVVVHAGALDQQALLDDLPDGQAWRQRAVGVLEDHLHLLAPVSYTHLTLPTNREV